MPVSDNGAIYQQSYAEGFSVATTACLAYLQRALPCSELFPHMQQFHNGLVQHLQAVMSNQMKGSPDGAPPSTAPSQPLPPAVAPPLCPPGKFLTVSPAPGNFPPAPTIYSASSYSVRNLPYQCLTPRMFFAPCIPGTCGTPITPCAAPVPVMPSPCTPRSAVPHPVALLGVHTPVADSRRHCQMERNRRNLEVIASGEVTSEQEKIRKKRVEPPAKLAETSQKDLKLWRPF
ncbi:unnamed protein product [Gongylonema pulchrum]|uniref:Orange domain-containing protein n=1 Tax=Gongylonema pulchrum TaxID=637853 RepID=A0A183DA93_9BILA|nr:unnamed protein product [Gongylonema pulchrum]